MRLTPTLLGTKPAVGSLSDLTGRRRPFVVLGALLVAGGLSLLAGAEARASVGAALLGLWLLDIGEKTRGRAPARASGGGGLTETKASTAPTRRCGCWRPTFAPALSRPWPTRRSRRASVWGRCEQEGPGRVPGKPDTPRPVPQIFGYCLSSVRFAPELHRAKVSDKAFCFALGAAAQVGALAATLALGPRAPPQEGGAGGGSSRPCRHSRTGLRLGAFGFGFSVVSPPLRLPASPAKRALFLSSSSKRVTTSPGSSVIGFKPCPWLGPPHAAADVMGV